jgi:hypothetical protein
MIRAACVQFVTVKPCTDMKAPRNNATSAVGSAKLARVRPVAKQYRGLELVALRLNALEATDVCDGPSDEAWRRVYVEVIAPVLQAWTPSVAVRHRLGSPLLTGGAWPPAAVKAFNPLAAASTVRLALDERGLPTLVHDPGDYLGGVLLLVWRLLFAERGWQRLRRCVKCSLWFVDVTRNRSTITCSEACYWRVWTRPYRAQRRKRRLRRGQRDRRGRSVWWSEPKRRDRARATKPSLRRRGSAGA